MLELGYELIKVGLHLLLHLLLELYLYLLHPDLHLRLDVFLRWWRLGSLLLRLLVVCWRRCGVVCV